MSVKDNKIPIDVKSLLSGRSLDQYATDNDDNDCVFLKISVLVPVGGMQKMMVLLRSSIGRRVITEELYVTIYDKK